MLQLDGTVRVSPAKDNVIKKIKHQPLEVEV